MATLNLGRIKPVFRGAYAGGTAYVVDDIVTSGNETFICILASTGNATSNATYWTKLAAKGTDGTDVGTTITTQGDILYRDGSGLQRLAKPASDMYLKNTSGGVLSWAAVSSDYVKIAEQVSTNLGASSFQFNNCFDDSTYKSYHLVARYALSGNNDRMICRYLDSSNNELGTSGDNYLRAGGQVYQKTDGSSGTTPVAWNDANGRNDLDIFNWSTSGNIKVLNYCEASFGKMNSTSDHQVCLMLNGGRDNSSANYIFMSNGFFVYMAEEDVRGIKFFHASGNNLEKVDVQLYGRK
tara:strand:+ start:186 stop:1073 length:888 start_codon:yes stop_codon:yes gene_type:complete